MALSTYLQDVEVFTVLGHPLSTPLHATAAHRAPKPSPSISASLEMWEYRRGRPKDVGLLTLEKRRLRRALTTVFPVLKGWYQRLWRLFVHKNNLPRDMVESPSPEVFKM